MLHDASSTRLGRANSDAVGTFQRGNEVCSRESRGAWERSLGQRGLDESLLCPLRMDPHGAELTPAAGGLDHPVAHRAGESRPWYPVAALPQPALPQGFELLIGPEFDGLAEGC